MSAPATAPDLAPGDFVDVAVEPHDALPDGQLLRFKAAGPARAVATVRYSPEVGPDLDCRVEGRDAAGAPVPALTAAVEDSGAGVSALVWGGARGLRLFALDGSASFAETHLLLAPEALEPAP